MPQRESHSCFRCDARPNVGGSTGCQQNCSALVGGFCGACILPECLRIGPDGSVRVALSASPQDWFGFLSGLGEVLQLTRNPVAVLGETGAVPALTDWRSPVLPRDVEARFQPNLAEHASLWAVRESPSAGVLFGLEARDLSGYAFQKIILTAPAQLERFEQFVVDHQSPPEEAGCWCPPNHHHNTERNRAVSKRISCLRACQARGAGVIQLPADIVPPLLLAAAQARMPLRTSHFHRALIRTVTWTPEAPNFALTPETDADFFHGANAGLQLFLPAVSGVWLWRGRCNRCAEQHWTVEIADANDAVSLTIKAGDNRLEPDWRRLLRQIAGQLDGWDA